MALQLGAQEGVVFGFRCRRRETRVKWRKEEKHTRRKQWRCEREFFTVRVGWTTKQEEIYKPVYICRSKANESWMFEQIKSHLRKERNTGDWGESPHWPRLDCLNSNLCCRRENLKTSSHVRVKLQQSHRGGSRIPYSLSSHPSERSSSHEPHCREVGHHLGFSSRPVRHPHRHLP